MNAFCISTFEDGKITPLKCKRDVCGKIYLKGACFSLPIPESWKVSEICEGRKALHTSFLLLQAGLSTLSIYKIAENFNIIASLLHNMIYYLPRRHAAHSSVSKGNWYFVKNSALPITESKFCVEFEGISFRTITECKIFRSSDKFNENCDIISLRKIARN